MPRHRERCWKTCNRIPIGFGDGWPETRPHLADWFARIQARANFRSAVLDWLPDDVVAALRRNGTSCLDGYEAAKAAA